MPREILHLLGSADESGSGIAAIVATLAARLDPAKYRVHVWFLDGPGPLARRMEAAGLRVGTIGWSRGLRDPMGALRFFGLLKARDFSLLHQHAGGESVRRLVRFASGAKVIVHLHGRIEESRPAPIVSQSPKGADRVIAASGAVALAVAPPIQPIVVYAGTPPAPTSRLRPEDPKGEPVVGTACRLVPVKGIRYLLGAIAILAGEWPGLRLEIAGAGPIEGDLRQMAIDLGIHEKVRFLGWRHDISTLHQRWDLFCIPSVEEGFGLAALEAMASGLPVVASRAGGLMELVEDGITGALVPAADAQALAEGIRFVIADDARRRLMGSAAHRRARDCFSADRMVRETENLYDSLLNPGTVEARPGS